MACIWHSWRRGGSLLRPTILEFEKAVLFFHKHARNTPYRASHNAVNSSSRTSSVAQKYGPHESYRLRNLYHSGARDMTMLGTTVLCVRKDDKVIVIGDGQVTLGAEIIKPNVRKVRRIGESVIGGFAGATADSFTLFERLENKLEEHPGQLTRAAVELAKAWRSDKFLRRLDAVMVVADAEISLTITGNGDVLEPYDGVIGIGSGGSFASAAARALIDLPNMNAETIALKAMKIAADCCIYTNHNFTIQRLDTVVRSPEVESEAATISKDDREGNGEAREGEVTVR